MVVQGECAASADIHIRLTSCTNYDYDTPCCIVALGVGYSLTTRKAFCNLRRKNENFDNDVKFWLKKLYKCVQEQIFEVPDDIRLPKESGA